MRFIEFPGARHSPFFQSERVLAEIHSFVTGTPIAALSNRFLTTLLFLDIVRSTERATVLGDDGWRDLLERYYALARRELRLYDGVEVDRAGDGLRARFDGPTRAIRFAVAIHEAARHLGIEIRFGVHAGECEATDETLVGIAVHIGARILVAAQPNEILVSSTVRDLVVGSGIEFRDCDYHVLKGVPGEWRLFSVKAD
jgi:class 3 adenylate cyclase